MTDGVLLHRRRMPGLALFAAVLYLALHVPFLSWTPDDIDATNFMLALEDFNLREHQPHPPGYPVFIAMAHVARVGITAATTLVGPLTTDTINLYALALCSAVSGGLIVIPLVRLWQAVDGDPARALLASVFAMAAPLFWYAGIRPLSDLPGLAATVASLALIVPVILGRVEHRPALHLLAGAAIAGIAVGVRMQSLWMTGPALTIALGVTLWRRDVRAGAFLMTGLGLGLMIWGVPFLIVTGGWRNYFDLLTAQAASDFRGAILAVDFSARALAFALRDTFVLPWGGPLLAAPVLLLALVGAVRLLIDRPRATMVIAAIFLPYLALHLLFHATNETRYAIPLLLPVTFFAVRGLSPATWPRWTAAVALVVIAAATGMRPVVSQARSGSPVARAWSELHDAMTASETEPMIAMHHSVRRQLRFVDFSEPPLHASARYEWLAVVDHFRSGGTRPVWFLANARRSDLALFDPAARRAIREYHWDFAPQAVLGGVRPPAVVWHEITRPGWMAGEGWSLTPETRGVAERSRRSPSVGGAVAYIARRAEAAVLLIGGRNLGGTCLTAARLQATLDGRPIGEWLIAAGEPFAQFVDLPRGALVGASGYAELRVTARDLTGSGAGVDVSLEQFDVQSDQKPVVALAQGWYEPELEIMTGEQWRWTGQRAVMFVRHFGRDVVLAIKADDPTRTLGRAVVLQVRVAGQVVASRRFDGKVEWDVTIPAALIERASGRVTLVSEAAFIPDRTQRNGDSRELSLRVMHLGAEFGEDTTAGGS